MTNTPFRYHPLIIRTSLPKGFISLITYIRTLPPGRPQRQSIMRLCGIGRKGYTCISSPSAVPDLTCPCFLLIISYTISSYSLMISAVAQAVIFWLTTALRIFLGIHPMGRAKSVIFCGQFNTYLSVSLPAPAFCFCSLCFPYFLPAFWAIL